jgi:hypothetical protein
MMCLATDNPTSCEIRIVIRFIHVRNITVAEIHHELCTTVYGQNIMSEENVRQRCRKFKDGRTNIHGEE